MSKIYLPSHDTVDWQQFLAEPEKQWKRVYSVMATCFILSFMGLTLPVYGKDINSIHFYNKSTESLTFIPRCGLGIERGSGEPDILHIDLAIDCDYLRTSDTDKIVTFLVEEHKFFLLADEKRMMPIYVDPHGHLHVGKHPVSYRLTPSSLDDLRFYEPYKTVYNSYLPLMKEYGITKDNINYKGMKIIFIDDISELFLDDFANNKQE